MATSLTDGTGVVRYASTSARDFLIGRIDELSLWCGQDVGLVREVLPAAEIVRRTVAEAEAIRAGVPDAAR